MENEFELALAETFASLTSIAGFGGLTLPTSDADFLQLTVGEFLDLLGFAEEALRANQPQIIALLSNPMFTADLDAETRAFLQDWAAGDYSFITSALDEARAELSGVPRETLLINVEGLDGDGGTLEDDFQLAFAEAEANLANLLWNDFNGLFTSPTFTVDPDTGSWFVPGAAFSGGTLLELWTLVGEAASQAMLSYFNSQNTLVNSLFSNGITAVELAQAEAAAQSAAADAFEALQGFGTTLTTSDDVDLTAFEALALAQYQTIIGAVTTILPGVASALTDLIVGSRNSAPTFVVNLEGNVEGSAEGDWFYLNDLANTFDGGLGQDILFGFGGNDRFTGGADDDTLFGGDGAGDTAVYSGPQARYTVQIERDGVNVIDRSGAEGTDQLSEIETLSFGDNSAFNLADQVGIASLSAEEIATFVELYIAYFNRAPDAEGLNFWGSAFANGYSLETIATLFLGQSETQQTYPDTLSNLDFATQVYNNVLGRDPDQGGLEFWVNLLDGGGVTRDQFILEALRGAKVTAPEGSTPEEIALRLGDVQYLADKTDIGTYFAVIRGLSDLNEADSVMDLFIRGDQSSINDAFEATNTIYNAALAADGGDFLIQLVGIVDDPFAI
ncbi:MULTISPECIES: DUF4214 domain-containing protein [Marivita]|uniref:DUF4214 domain-containing protein n=1 Tax=Marivita cryptomonadis TaxID=505252 RepID=A0A9Q2PAN0_9RHOB|nr:MULTISPECIES: DUF4214 domain-containing protein [Marivita]MBM2321388.1 DUF4214 domain-containing protein [Marivita cryptomonadis]MBM2330969.1 DUF4214 domain-containing protein [Marivita cryptomonadis]MBM2340555.1 DUF4214 domain-containing protein [Marivita cryptomonadis]MBM2345217.1 DUF4214 domain-containing protein [Marivita cryptomonadis]MBM2349895.1 DUF4214 domain-containing protein [Marivita cryptomonadis]